MVLHVFGEFWTLWTPILGLEVNAVNFNWVSNRFCWFAWGLLVFNWFWWFGIDLNGSGRFCPLLNRFTSFWRVCVVWAGFRLVSNDFDWNQRLWLIVMVLHWLWEFWTLWTPILGLEVYAANFNRVCNRIYWFALGLLVLNWFWWFGINLNGLGRFCPLLIGFN